MNARLLTMAGTLAMICLFASTQAAAAERLVVQVPEPSVLAMAGVGVAGLAGAIWRKVRQ